MKLERRRANNPPQDWSAEEEKRMLKYLRTSSFNGEELKELFPGRSLPSIRSKVRKLRILHDLFGDSYREKKEEFTIEIANNVKPKVVFDAYAGAGHQAFKWIQVASKVYASEILKSKLKQFDKTAQREGFKKMEVLKRGWIQYKKGTKSVYLIIGDAVDAATNIRYNKIKVDLVDLDTCGSTLPILPTLLLLTRPQHVVITHGEFHSMRFKREDVLRRLFVHRDIRKNPLPLKVAKMSKELDKAVKTAAFRAHNETVDSFWLEKCEEIWLGGKFHGMLRRHYKVERPAAASDCINELSAR